MLLPKKAGVEDAFAEKVHVFIRVGVAHTRGQLGQQATN